MASMQRFLGPAIVVILAGCQTMSPQDPLSNAPVALPEACVWPRSGEMSRQDWLRASVEALEARGFSVRNTDAVLGVVSAERETRLHGLGAVDRAWFGGSALWGSLGRGTGLSLGYGMRFGDDPVRFERLSVVISDDEVRLTRDVSVVNPDGYLVDARPDNRGDFCRELSASVEAKLRAARSQAERREAEGSHTEESRR